MAATPTSALGTNATTFPLTSCSPSSSSFNSRSTNARSAKPRNTSMAASVGLRRLGASLLRLRKPSQLTPRRRRLVTLPAPSPSQFVLRESRSVAVAAWKQEVLWAEAPLVAVEPAADSLYHVELDVSDNPDIIQGYTSPGQFVQIRIGNSKPVFLAIASPPKEDGGSLEFLVKDVEGSTAGYLCDLRKGDTVELSQVMGDGFNVQKIGPAEKCPEVYIFATGSGISPIRALLEFGLDADKRSKVVLYYGVRNLRKMAYQERFKEWESSGVNIIPVLSQPHSEWAGERGYVQAAFVKDKDINNPTATGAVLCGHKQMTEEVTTLLVSDGVSKEKILKNF